MALYAGLGFLTVAITDFAFQRRQFTKKNMMSKDEAKREYKESNGNPLVRAKRKQLHMELFAKGMTNRSRRGPS
ncbi:MAG: EscU/YscU/HrcU family type III secretion system export apparatus switch protein [Mesorhizobium sp.]|nr:MAG: EscU/YscU/HrcU family type III secretion system export apparatus switch protein [Mesorhizobium sp.]